MAGPFFLPRYYEELDDELVQSVENDEVADRFIEELPRLSKLKGKLSDEEAEELLLYMDACPVLNAWMSRERDPFLDESPVIPCVEYSDGTYVWREMHRHLVEKYRVAMPPQFTEHVKAFSEDYESLKKTDLSGLQDLRIGFGRFHYDQLKYP